MVDADKCSIFFVDDVRKEVWCVGSLLRRPKDVSCLWSFEIVNIANQATQTAISIQIFNLLIDSSCHLGSHN